MKRVLIAGATSAIAHAAARRFAGEGATLMLAARDPDRLAANAADLCVLGAARVETFVIDFDETPRQAELLAAAEADFGGLDLILVAWGVLPDQAACEGSVALTLAAWQTNATATIAFLTRAAMLLERQRQGTLAVISSVAGDRGRRDNYVYGAAKAAIDAFLQGLRARLHGAGVRVITIKPGPTDTPMTAHRRKGPLFVSAERAGDLVYRAAIGSREVVYAPAWWRPIMLAIRLIPEGLMKRLNLSA
ncbi:MAG: SDR family NAD(P)-dependent oxidoreductase [Caldilineae bacterium]|nr:SDR family NAD(P)-dependent oxidoreductase [Chloroflexota bacterium]MCB9177092.1 SDR family NAD(P)-dependent oxidoreductase [Caldilineae bacterium]